MLILVVEDEARMAALLEQGLREEGHQVTLRYSGPEALEEARVHRFDLIVLDVMLPGMDGFEVVRQLRKDSVQTPVLLLTAKDNPHDIIAGLDAGADDYITKPFAFDVFLARVRAVSRRGPVEGAVVYQIGDLSINLATREVRRSTRTVELTQREFALLEFLARRSPRVIEREALLEEIWGHDGDVSANTLEAFVHLLRSKIEQEGERKLVRTVRGVGYCLRADEAA